MTVTRRARGEKERRGGGGGRRVAQLNWLTFFEKIQNILKHILVYWSWWGICVCFSLTSDLDSEFRLEVHRFFSIYTVE